MQIKTPIRNSILPPLINLFTASLQAASKLARGVPRPVVVSLYRKKYLNYILIYMDCFNGVKLYVQICFKMIVVLFLSNALLFICH